MIIKEIVNRRSVREYDPRPVSQEHIIEIIKAGQFAPTARNNRAVEFITIENQETKDKIFGIVGQEFVRQAPVLIIPTIDLEKTVCPIEDLSVASENMLLQATSLELGSVWKAVKTADEEKGIKQLLNIPQSYKIINLIPIGYWQIKPEFHSDQDFDQKRIYSEKWEIRE
jgi:nitroreductase